MAQSTLLLTLDLAGTFAFALDGSITGLDAAKLDIVGMLALGMTTALGGGILRDILIGAGPAGLGNLLDRVSLAGVDRNKSHLPGLVEPLVDQIDRMYLAGSPELRAVTTWCAVVRSPGEA
ncbi:MAG: trimeric intracellular cation channel family protein [Streptosporangiaceae bacterium]